MSSTPLFRKPQALRRGDPVAIIAPAGPFDRESFDAGLALIAQRYRVRYDEHLFDRYRYLAGADERRLAQLAGALQDPEIKAIFCARGGYGAMRLLAGLTPLPQHQPLKPLVGFSDITALHQWLQSQGVVSIHGPVVTQFGRQAQGPRDRLFSLLESPLPAAPLSGTATYVGGRVKGPLIGGNLTVFTQLLGTPFLPPLTGSILLIEDVGERPYRLDRMWKHLELAGIFGKIAGIVMGSFSHCEQKEASYRSTDVLR